MIRAMTGLQELQKLRTHMRRAHLVNYTMNEALEIRIRMEEQNDEKEKGQHP